MSRTISLNTDPDERDARLARRAARKQRIRDKAQALADWRHARAAAAEERAEQRRIELDAQPRGVDRVPPHLHVHRPAPEPVLYGKRDTDQARPLAQPEDLHPSGNYATRRARGHRGHQRPRRRREMPGAVARRLERNRRAWSQA